ncbi:putative mitochondrial adenine nucleotide transporter BTL3 [Hibiscus syriacus]|uniref:Mitochondrial adenine nucleotide transporter BTL3 n=1 Tax=Hibiscus syriacus TaxID=106335 RepID=A0A6A2ZNV7_HIBSY|nr:putative mitochondrial adenine nucleotide transporter BTL3 [Hibiscus syriacus]
MYSPDRCLFIESIRVSLHSKDWSYSVSCEVEERWRRRRRQRELVFIGEFSREEGYVGESGEDDENLEAVKIVEEEKEKKGSGALNTTKHLWTGAVAAMVSRTFIVPLERLKLEYIVRGEKKNIFELIKQLAAIEGNEEATNSERFLAGAAAGITATLLCLPMDTIRTVMIAPGGEALGGLIGAFRHMIQTEGFFSLYKGLVPSIISMAPSGAVFYGVYDILKSAYLRSPEGRKRIQNMKQGGHELNAFEQLELGPVRTLLYGAISGACSEAATYPFEVVRRHLQMQVRATKLSALANCVKIVQEGGVSALYAGLTPILLQVLPSAAISYLVYEFTKIVLKVEPA